jgi:hypothetical protein
MSRFYSLQFSNVSVSAVQDLFSVLSTANMAFKLCEFQLSADASTTVAELRLAIKRLPATVTVGSAGSAVTPQPMDAKGAAATVTARSNDTTQATTTGTAVTLFSASINVLNGWQFLPPPEYRPTFTVSQAMVITMEVAPSATVFDGYAVIEEIL